MDVALPDAPTAFYRHGWQSWSPSRWRDVDEPVLPIRHADHRVMHDDPAHALDTVAGGSGIGAARLADGRIVALVCRVVGGWVSLVGDRLRGEVERPDPDMADDAWVVIEGAADEETAVFERAARILGDAFGTRPARHPRAWCSWYSMYTEIDHDRLSLAVDGLAGLPLEVFQIDDGWQHHIGDWDLRADRFPDGFDTLVSQIRDSGREAGLWLAPLLVHEDARIVVDRPEWLLTDDDGQRVSAGFNWGGALYALDSTSPGVSEHVQQMISTAVGQGFTYLKLDFLYAGALPGRRHDDLPREVAYRRAIEAIRGAAGEDTYLLACGAPLIASLGVFDGARIGPDVNEAWEHPQLVRYTRTLGEPSTRWAISTSVNRLWQQPLWDCDPDVAYFRDHRCLLSVEQKQLLQDLATISGFRVTSDPPSWLTEQELARLSDWLAHDPVVTRSGPLQWVIDGRTVDFGPVATAPPTLDPQLP